MIDLVLLVAVTLFVYLICRFIYLRKSNIHGSKIRVLREFLMAGFVAYSVIMFALLFFYFFSGFMDKGFFHPMERIKYNLGINLIPFKTINDFIFGTDNYENMIRNVVGNILLFVPVSFLMAVLWPKWRRFGNMFLFSVFLPIGIEFIQLFIGRSVDVDDVILNFTGLMLGFIITKILMGITRKSSRS